MAIVRVKHNKDNPYVQINKTPLEDSNLSLKAKGLLCFLLSRPDNWKINVRHLQTITSDKQCAIRSAIKELISLGYAERTQIKDPHTKQFRSWEYIVREIPNQEKPQCDFPDVENPDVENPDVENPDVENPDVENQTHNNKESTKKELTKKRENKAAFFSSSSLVKGLSEGEEQWLTTESGQWLQAQLKKRGLPQEDWKLFLDYFYKHYLINYYPEDIKPGSAGFNTRIRNAVNNKFKDTNGQSILLDYLDSFSAQKLANQETSGNVINPTNGVVSSILDTPEWTDEYKAEQKQRFNQFIAKVKRNG